MWGRFGWGTMLVLAMLISLYALASALAPGLRSPFVEDIFAMGPARALGHMAAGGIALAAGALQFSTRLRVEKPRVHRAAGLVYVLAVLVSGTAAVLLAPFSTGGVAAHYGFGMLGVLWLATSVVAYLRVRSRDYEAHREWMIRSYALCLAAVTLRIYLPISGLAGIPFEEAYPAIAWLCWVPNLVVAEWFFVRSRFVSLESPA